MSVADGVLEEADVISTETVRRLTQFDGGGLPVISVYVGRPVGTSPRGVESKVHSLLDGIRLLAKDESLSHDARRSVREDLERMEQALVEQPWKPGTAAVFSCSRGGLFEQVRLPRPVRDRLVVDTSPWLRAMLAVLDEYHRSAVVVLDKASARVSELYLDELREVTKVRDAAPRKPNYAGWHGLAEHRVRHRAQEKANAHFRKVADVTADLVRTEGLELLIVGGHEHELPRFIEFLPRSLRDRVAGTFTLDPRTATTADIRRHADAVIESYERDEERRWVAEVFDTAAAGGRAVIGLAQCLWGGSVAAVADLLVQEGVTVPGVVCDTSGWLATEGETCPVCGRPTRPTPDVVDELVEAVIDDGGRVEHVQAETPLRDHVAAASLRFPLPAGDGGRPPNSVR
jgi:peptide subunit release factor 1 (eRF1)